MQELEPELQRLRDELRARCNANGADKATLERWHREGAALDEAALRGIVERLCGGA